MHVVGVIEIDPSTMPSGYSFHAMRDELEPPHLSDAQLPAQARQLAAQHRPPGVGRDADFDIREACAARRRARTRRRARAHTN